MRTRAWVTGLSAVGVAVFCGVAVAGWLQGDAQRERSRSDAAVRAYLTLTAIGDYQAAYALVCTDETGTDRGSFEETERSNPIRRFDIESSTSWSSFVDGHGRVYRVWVTRSTGASLVEVRTQGSNPVCIQYGNITS